MNFLVYNGQKLEESSWCSIPFNEETGGSLYMSLASTVIYFFIPLVIVSFMYTRYKMIKNECDYNVTVNAMPGQKVSLLS